MADEASKAPEKQDKALLNISANASDLLGGGAATSKLFETVGAHLGQLLSGVGDLINVLFLDRKKVQNEAYKIRELSDAQAYSTRAQASEIVRLMSAGQQVQTMNIEDGKVNARLAGVSPEVLALYQHSATQAAHDNILHYLNREQTVVFAAAELANTKDVSKEPVDPDWVSSFFRTAEGISNEEMQLLFGKILAGEVTQPGTFSLRTINFLSTLTKSEANIFREVCAFVWQEYHSDDLLLVIPELEAKNWNVNIPPYGALLQLSEIGLIEISAGLFSSGYSYTMSNIMLTYDKQLFEIIAKTSEGEQKERSIPGGRVRLTKMGKELAKVCQPVHNPCVIEFSTEFWTKRGCEVTKVEFTPKPADITEKI